MVGHYHLQISYLLVAVLFISSVSYCKADPTVLSSPIGSTGLIISEDDGSTEAVLPVCIASTIRPAPSSATDVDWSTEASGGESVFRNVTTSLSDSGGCYWSNLTVNISSVSGAAGHYTVKVSTDAGSATKRFRLEI
eukprot:scpid108527/ scgid16951/ 